MPAKRGAKKAQPADPPPPSVEAEPEPDVVAGDGEADAAEAPAPTNRAERRALAKRKGAPPPAVRADKQYGRGAPATQTPRHWQGRRGG
jgi:hypothetical protein